MNDEVRRAGDSTPVGAVPFDERGAHAATAAHARRTRLVASDLAAVLLVVAAAGHLAEVGHHGALFGAVGVVQLVGALLLARRPSAAQRALVVGGLVALTGLWVVSRTAGLPVGPHAGQPQAVGLVDGVTVAAQLAAVVALVRPRARARSFAFATALVLVTGGAISASPPGGGGAGVVGGTGVADRAAVVRGAGVVSGAGVVGGTDRPHGHGHGHGDGHAHP